MDKRRDAEQDEERKVRAEERLETQTMLRMLFLMMNNANQQPSPTTIEQAQHSKSLKNDVLKRPRVGTNKTIDMVLPDK